MQLNSPSELWWDVADKVRFTGTIVYVYVWVYRATCFCKVGYKNGTCSAFSHDDRNHKV